MQVYLTLPVTLFSLPSYLVGVQEVKNLPLFGRFPWSSKLSRIASGLVERRDLVTLRLVPGRNTSNRTNYRLFHTLHELGEMKESLLKRISVKPFKIRETEQLWWDIIITRDAARFYLTLQDGEWVDWVKGKIERIWEGVIVSRVTEEDMELINVSDSATVNKLSLKRHNMFSLAVDRREETHPVGDLLGVIDDLKEDEKVRLAAKFDPVNRIKWQNAAQNAHKRFNDGQMPRRAAAGPGQILGSGLHVVMWLVGQIIESFANFIPGGSKYESPLTLQKDDKARRDVLIDGRLSRGTFEKANLPVFACDLYVMAQARDGTRGEGLISSIVGALGSEMDENNEWVKVKTDSGVIKLINVRQLKRTSLDRVALSTKEFGKIAQLPTATVQDQYRRQVMASEKLSIDLPIAITSGGIPYGIAESKGKQVPVYFPINNKDETVKVLTLTGESGSGKTTAIQNRVLGALAAGKSVFCYEFTKRKFLDVIINALPAEFPDDHIVCLDHGNKQWPICPAWTEVSYGIEDSEDVLAGEFWTFFAKGAEGELARTQMWLKHAALSCAEAGKLDPLNVVLMLLSREFREEVLTEVRDPLLKGMWKQWEKASQANQITMAAPIISRLNHILGHRHLKYSICQQPKVGRDNKPLIDMRKWADGDERGPYLVLHYIPKAAFGAAALDTFMGWYNAKEWLMTLTRDEDSPECLVFKDEVHQIPSLAAKAEEQIVEGRKYRVGQNWAFHSWAQIEKISPSLFKILKSNNPNICLLKSDEDTYKMLAKQLQPFDLEKDLMKMESYWSANKWRVGGKDVTQMCKLNGPPKLIKDRTYLWELHSRIYGRQKEDVAHAIAEREMKLFQIAQKAAN